jgi:hypothetical protein
MANMSQLVQHETQYRSPEESSAEPPYGGALKGAARALQGNLPGVDQAVAGLQSVLPLGLGGTGQGYDANLATQGSANAQFSADNPWANAAGATAAGAGPAVLGAPAAISAMTSPLAHALAGPAIGGAIGYHHGGPVGALEAGALFGEPVSRSAAPC